MLPANGDWKGEFAWNGKSGDAFEWLRFLLAYLADFSQYRSLCRSTFPFNRAVSRPLQSKRLGPRGELIITVQHAAD